MYGYVDIDEFPLDLIVLDKDVLSLEAPPFFRSFFLVTVSRVLFSVEFICISVDILVIVLHILSIQIVRLVQIC